MGAMKHSEDHRRFMARGIIAAGAVLCCPRTVVAQSRSCPPGYYGVEEPSGVTCNPWSVCVPGEHVVSWGTNVADRTCAECPPGTFTSAPNTLACLPFNNCPPGTYVSGGPTTSAGRTCAPCQTMVSFADSTNMPQCQIVRDCPPGTYVSQLPSRAVDRQCTQCAIGTLSYGTNQFRCNAKSPCPTGTYEASIGTTTTDRTCNPLEVTCVAPFIEVAPVTATSDRVCEEDRCLRPGQYAHCPYDTPVCAYVS